MMFGKISADYRPDYEQLWLESPNASGYFYESDWGEVNFVGDAREIPSYGEVDQLLALADTAAEVNSPLTYKRITFAAEDVPAFAKWLRKERHPNDVAMKAIAEAAGDDNLVGYFEA